MVFRNVDRLVIRWRNAFDFGDTGLRFGHIEPEALGRRRKGVAALVNDNRPRPNADILLADAVASLHIRCLVNQTVAVVVDIVR